MLRSIKLCFWLTVIHFFSSLAASVCTDSLVWLLNDMKAYKFHDVLTSYHQGDLYEHSMCVYYAAIGLAEHGEPYPNGIILTKREKELFILAALRHDVGKAGRKDLFDKVHPKLFISSNPVKTKYAPFITSLMHKSM